MRKIFSVLAVISAAIISPPQAGAESWYAGGFGGLNFTHDGSVDAAGTDAAYDLGVAVGGYVGFLVQNNLRIEAELSYRTNDIDTIGGVASGGKVETLAVMANALFDFEIESSIDPYLGAGLGIADVSYSVVDDTVLAFQLIAGAGMEIAPATQLTIDYRMFVTEDLKIGGGLGFGNIEYVNSAVMLGVKRTF